MRTPASSPRLAGVGALGAALLLTACLAAPPVTAPGDGPDAQRSARPVRIDAATPYPLLTHAPRPEPTDGQASAAPATAAPATVAPSAPASPPAATAPPTLTDVLKATALASAPPLAEQDAADVAEALADDEVEVLLPADLIHDGGTALYRLVQADEEETSEVAPSPATSASLEPDAGASEPPAARTSPRPKATPTPAEPPAEWRRQDVVVGKQEALTARGERKGEAAAAVGYLNQGVFAYRAAAGEEPVRKPFRETFSRQVALKKGKAAWHPQALGPIRIATPGAAGGLEIASLRLTAPDDASIGFTIGAEDVLTPLTDLPHAVAGAKLRVEATVRDQAPGEFFVYGRLAGPGAPVRVRLRDDGTAEGDVAGDGVYVWELEAPAKAGWHHLVIDVLDARCFAKKGAVRAVALGLTFEVKD